MLIKTSNGIRPGLITSLKEDRQHKLQIMHPLKVGKRKEKRKEKITPVFLYRRDYEPVGLTLIIIFRDAMCGFMPPLGRRAQVRH